MTTSRIRHVAKKPSGLFVIHDDAGGVYATKNHWLASLCDRAREQAVTVRLSWSSGWWYRELRAIELLNADGTVDTRGVA